MKRMIIGWVTFYLTVRFTDYVAFSCFDGCYKGTFEYWVNNYSTPIGFIGCIFLIGSFMVAISPLADK